MLLNVRDFATVQEALDAAADGDCVYFPSVGVDYRAPSTGWVIQRSLVVCGDGPGATAGAGSVLLAADENSPVIRVASGVKRVTVADLQLKWDGSVATGTGDGLICEAGVTAVDIERVAVVGCGGNGFNFVGGNAGSQRIDRVGLVDCSIVGCRGAGVRASYTDNLYMTGVVARDNWQNGVTITGGSGYLYECEMDGNCLTPSWTPSANPYEGQMRFTAMAMVRAEACRIRNIERGSVKRGCVVTGSAGMIGSCCFEATNAASASSCEGIVVAGAGTGPVFISGNRHSNMGTMVRVDAGSTNPPLVRQCTVLPQYDDTGNGSMSLTGVPDGLSGVPHAMRAGSSVLAGIPIPAYVQDPISGARNGMMAYNRTLKKLRIYVNGAWRTVELE